MKEIYLDNSATTKLDDEVIFEMVKCMKEDFGNPSSVYSLGRKAKAKIEEAREKIAGFLNAEPSEIYFTSGGTESDNTALLGIANANISKGNHIITLKIEHPAVLETCKLLESRGFDVSYIDVDKNGIVKVEELKKAIKENTILISIMFANNEIGTIQPISEIGEIAKQKGIIFHTDAVQACGSIDIDVEKLNVDSLSLSAHKFYGPKGIGVLYVRKGVNFQKLLNGGHQERNKRAGTENIVSIVGMAKAFEIAERDLEKHNKQIETLRDYCISQILEKLPNVKINGDLNKRLCGNVNVSFENVEGESLLRNLDLRGICVSAGSACSSGSINPSHVLMALGLSEELAKGSIRISIGKYNSKEEIDVLVNSLIEIVERLRK